MLRSRNHRRSRGRGREQGLQRGCSRGPRGGWITQVLRLNLIAVETALRPQGQWLQEETSAEHSKGQVSGSERLLTSLQGMLAGGERHQVQAQARWTRVMRSQPLDRLRTVGDREVWTEHLETRGSEAEHKVLNGSLVSSSGPVRWLVLKRDVIVWW